LVIYKARFFPPNFFFGILEKGNLSEQKKIWREITLLNLAVQAKQVVRSNFYFGLGWTKFDGFQTCAKNPASDSKFDSLAVD
jgi:hypothetical protein